MLSDTQEIGGSSPPVPTQNKVDRFFPSSKMCSRCGSVKKELRLDERIYRCGCGNCMDRDVNAAVNIREEGRRLLMTA